MNNTANSISMSNQGLDRLVKDLFVMEDEQSFQQDYSNYETGIEPTMSSVEYFKLFYPADEDVESWLLH